eukprot:g2027.t1
MVVTAAVMEEYFDHIAKLNEEFPEAWHLIMQAEDRCRGEVFERYRRQLWGGKSMSNRSAEDVNVSEDARAALAGVAGSMGALHRDPKRRRRESKTKDSPPGKETKPDTGADKAEPHSKNEHPKKWGTHYITDYDGNEICFKQQSVKGESKFKFLELYAGFKGLSMAMADVVGESVEVLKPLELYDGWDVLTPEGLEEARKAAREADHLHVAIPCRSYTRARRVDAHGAVATVRSDERPEGWGHPVAEKGNRHLEAIEIILMEAARSGCTISIENPWNSFLWETAKMKKLAKRLHLVPVYLEQCAYGGMSRKPTRILTDAEWMQTVQLTCSQVRPHCHSKLEGKVWDPVTQSKVWKTSKAAEYPSGLCRAWAMALKDYLQAKPLILQKKTYEKEVMSGIEHGTEAAANWPLIGQEGDPSKLVPKESMLAALKEDAIYLKDRGWLKDNTDMDLVSGHSLRRSGVLQAQISGLVTKVDNLEDLARKIAEEHKNQKQVAHFDEDSVKSLLRAYLKPPVVTNLATLKFHATSVSNNHLIPSRWQTACGWCYVAAGQLVKPAASYEEIPTEATPCTKCMNYLPYWAAV